MPLRKDELSMTESLGYEALLSDWNMPGIALGFKLLQKYFGIQLKCNTFDTTGKKPCYGTFLHQSYRESSLSDRQE